MPVGPEEEADLRPFDEPPELEDVVEVQGSAPAPATHANASSRQLLLNFATSYLGLVVALLLSLFLTPISLHYLGTSTYGLWIVITAIGGYVGILDSGVSTAVVQLMASATASNDNARVAEILATARKFFRVTAILAIFVIVALLPLLGTVIGVGGQSLDTARLALFLSGLLTAMNFLASVPTAAIFGSGRNSRAAILGTCLSVLTQGTSILVVVLGGGLIGLLAVTVVSAVVSYVFMIRIARRIGLPGRHQGRASRPMMSELFHSGRRNAVVGLGGTIAYQLDSVVVGVILPVHDVTPYDLGLSTGNFVRNAATAATNLLLPAYAHSSTVDDSERQFRLYSRAVLASMCITAPMVVALVAFGEPLLRLWLGTVPSHTFQVLVAINLVLLIQLPGHQSFIFLTGIGRNKILARMALPSALINLALSVGATYWLGPVGPAIGSLPQVAILDFAILPVMSCRAMGIATRRYLREAMLPVVVPLLAAVAAAVTLRALAGNTSRLWAPMEAVAITLIAWAALAPFLMKTDAVFNGLVMRGRQHLVARYRK